VLRKIFLLIATGIIWYQLMWTLFVRTGAQNILANPELQSQKFLEAFTAAPFPRMTETWFMLKGMFVIGLFLAGSFIYINDKIKGGWIVKGLKIGILFFAVAIPWFEFYLPYNIMLEPLPLVLFEVLLWFGVYSLLGIIMSFILNYRRKN